MNDVLLWLILLGTVANVALAVIIVIRASRSLHAAGKEVREELRSGREETQNYAKGLREEVSTGLKSANETLSTNLSNIGKYQQQSLETLTRQLRDLTESNQQSLERIQTSLGSQVNNLREGNEAKLVELRKSVDERLDSMTKRLEEMTQSIRTSLDQIRDAVDSRIKELQRGNEEKLEQMRKTVDEKLQDTLQTRLGESFKLVSERLEAVQRGLGEMQNLATGVGDLKRVLTNVKVRGTWAEVQLGAILEQMMTPGQYEKNVQTKEETREAVEYAIRLPGPKDEPKSCVWLPIDSKFPQEDYLRLQEAAEKGNPDAVQKATEALVRTIRISAQEIHDKYINVPSTTDFAIMFLATEGLYAEVVRQPSLVDELQQRYRIVPVGPTTLAALLSSLQMGFQTLAIEQRAGEVWRILGAIKTEFAKFGEVLDTVKRQLVTACRTIEKSAVRSRAMERKLRAVERLTDGEASRILELPEPMEPMQIEDKNAEEPNDQDEDD